MKRVGTLTQLKFVFEAGTQLKFLFEAGTQLKFEAHFKETI